MGSSRLKTVPAWRSACHRRRSAAQRGPRLSQPGSNCAPHSQPELRVKDKEGKERKGCNNGAVPSPPSGSGLFSFTSPTLPSAIFRRHLPASGVPSLRSSFANPHPRSEERRAPPRGAPIGVVVLLPVWERLSMAHTYKCWPCVSPLRLISALRFRKNRPLLISQLTKDSRNDQSVLAREDSPPPLRLGKEIKRPRVTRQTIMPDGVEED